MCIRDSSMSAGISAMKAHMDALTVVGNNVANVNTYGYKPGRVTFKESIYSTQAAGSDGTETLGGTNQMCIRDRSISGIRAWMCC